MLPVMTSESSGLRRQHVEDEGNGEGGLSSQRSGGVNGPNGIGEPCERKKVRELEVGC